MASLASISDLSGQKGIKNVQIDPKPACLILDGEEVQDHQEQLRFYENIQETEETDNSIQMTKDVGSSRIEGNDEIREALRRKEEMMCGIEEQMALM